MTPIRNPADGSTDEPEPPKRIFTGDDLYHLELEAERLKNSREKFHVPTAEELKEHYSKYNLGFIPKKGTSDNQT